MDYRDKLEVLRCELTAQGRLDKPLSFFDLNRDQQELVIKATFERIDFEISACSKHVAYLEGKVSKQELIASDIAVELLPI